MTRAGAVPALLLLASCGIAVPADRRDYVGTWRGPDMALAITAAGHVEYQRRRGAATTSVSAPLRSFAGDDFVVGAMGITTTFHVQRRPYLDGTLWKMMVDSVELTRER
jgi:hypothetical protein